MIISLNDKLVSIDQNIGYKNVGDHTISFFFDPISMDFQRINHGNV